MIIPATSSDYAEVREVWASSVKATHSFLPEDYFQKIWELFYDFIPSVDLYIHRSNDARIDGFVGVAGQKIEMLFLRPECFGKGIGKKLCVFAIDNLHAIKVDVNEQNEKATAFYNHMGFEVIKRNDVDGMGKPFPILEMSLIKKIP